MATVTKPQFCCWDGDDHRYYACQKDQLDGSKDGPGTIRGETKKDREDKVRYNNKSFRIDDDDDSTLPHKGEEGWNHGKKNGKVDGIPRCDAWKFQTDCWMAEGDPDVGIEKREISDEQSPIEPDGLAAVTDEMVPAPQGLPPASNRDLAKDGEIPDVQTQAELVGLELATEVMVHKMQGAAPAMDDSLVEDGEVPDDQTPVESVDVAPAMEASAPGIEGAAPALDDGLSEQSEISDFQTPAEQQESAPTDLGEPLLKRDDDDDDDDDSDDEDGTIVPGCHVKPPGWKGKCYTYKGTVDHGGHHDE